MSTVKIYDEPEVELTILENGTPITLVIGGGSLLWGQINGNLSDQTDLQNALNAKVPYSGATGNVNLGEYGISSGFVQLDTTPTTYTPAVGNIGYNDSVGTLETTLKGGTVQLKIGRDMFERVVNKTGVQLTKAAYQAVRISTAQGQRLGVALAQANNDNNSADTIGLAVETIDNNQEGNIYTVGEITGINTTGSLQSETWVDGDVLYLSPTVAGMITNVKPIAPQHLVVIGYVVYSHANNGKIYVKVMNGWELGELHDVDTTGATNGQVLKYNGTIWAPSADAGVTGSGIAGQVAYWNSPSTITSNFKLSFSDSTGLLGINTFTPNYRVNAVGTASTNNGIVASETLGREIGIFSSRSTTGQAALSVISNHALTFETVGTERARLTTTGNLLLGTTTDVGTSILTMDSTTKGFLRPRMSTAQRDGIVSPATGLSIYNTSTNKVNYYNGSAWTEIQDTITNPVTGTGVSGQVSYWSGTNTQAGSNNLFWDNANGRLGIGTNSPQFKVVSLGAANTNNGFVATESGGRQIGLFSSKGNTGQASLSVTTNHPLTFETNATEIARFFANGNLALNSTTDSGQRLQVTGDTLLKGSGNTSATTALTVQNSDGTNIFRVRNDSNVLSSNITAIAGAMSISSTGAAIAGNYLILNNGGLSFTNTSGNINHIRFLATFAPTSGTGTYVQTAIDPTINQTGGANGITRGLYVNPTLTAAADWRSIEWSNNTGWGLYGAGTADNYLGGRLGIGTLSIGASNVNISRQLSGSTNYSNLFVGGSVQSDVTSLANGISLSIGTQNTVFTLNNLRHISVTQGTFGASSIVSNQYAFLAGSSLTGATNNYGFYGDIASGTGRWNLYMNGTANNYLAGALGIGTTSPQQPIHIRGTGSASAGRTWLRVENTQTSSGSGVQLYNGNGRFAAVQYTASGYATGEALSFFTEDDYPVSFITNGANPSSGTSYVAFSPGGYSNESVRFTGNGRVLIGTTTDAGFKLDVNGTARVQSDVTIKGSGNTFATTALTVQNSDAANLFSVRNDGFLRIGNAGASRPVIFPQTNAGNSQNLTGTNLSFYSYTTSQSTSSGRFWFGGESLEQTTGNNYGLSIGQSFSPTSGTATFGDLFIRTIINQTGGANGITRGLYVNPTLTAAADWRSIEWSNNTGWGLYGAGTANNYLAGSLGIGTTTLNNSALRVNKAITGAVTQSSIANNSTINSDVTSNAWMYASSPSTQASSFTLSELVHFNAFNLTIGLGSSITNNIGFKAESNLTGATNNYGFFGNIASGTGRWNLYMGGTADNYIEGNIGVGGTSITSFTNYRSLDIKGKTSTAGGVILLGTSGGESVLRVVGDSNPLIGTYTNTKFGLYTNSTERATIFGNGNFAIGTTTDAGFKLDVNGTARVTPPADSVGLTISGYSVTGSGTSSMLNLSGIWNTTGNVNGIFMNITNTASGGSSNLIDLQSSGVSRFRVTPGGLIGVTSLSEFVGYRLTFTGGLSNTSGTQNSFSSSLNINPTSGTLIYNNINLSPTINQTGGANGITRGLFINPTLTAAADWRSIETSNNSGYALYLGGSADAFFNDGADFQFGTTTGTKIGTATSQKLGFWNAAPIVQPTTGVASATRVGGGGTALTDTDTFDGYTLKQVVKALRDLGLLA